MICCSVNGNGLSFFAENAWVWSLKYGDAGSLDSENANTPSAFGPWSSKVTICK